MGEPVKFHDHFTIPTQEFSSPAARQYKEAHPQLKEMLQRLMIEYHASSAFYDHVHHNVVGAAIEDAVYAPLYYGYGGKESGAPGRSPEGQRTTYARVTESRIMKRCPNVVLVLMKASPEVIRGRRRENPTVEPRGTDAWRRKGGRRRVCAETVRRGVRCRAHRKQNHFGHHLGHGGRNARGVCRKARAVHDRG